MRIDDLGTDSALVAVLGDAQAAGFLGRAPLIDHIDNGMGFAAAVHEVGADRCVDLGSGGGVPALVVARALSNVTITCVDRGTKRCEFLAEAIERLELDDRMLVVEGDAEDAARDVRHEGEYDIVTARSFGPPAVTAEAAARLLVPDGVLIVSEPPSPDAGVRWADEAALSELGLRFERLFEAETVTLALVRRTKAPLDARYPRRAATVRKRPLF